jgi:hypothetical protein
MVAHVRFWARGSGIEVQVQISAGLLGPSSQTPELYCCGYRLGWIRSAPRSFA